MSLGSRINDIRKEKKISIDELCMRSGVPKGTLSKITAGITTNPTLDTVQAIAKALGCRLDDLDDLPAKEKGLLSPAEQCLIQKYRALDAYGQDAVSAVLDCEHKRCIEQAAERRPMVQAAAYGGGIKQIEEIHPDEIPTDEELLP